MLTDKITTFFDIISKFACVHDDIYFEAGMLVGFQLYKELTENYEHHEDKDITAILEKKNSHLIQTMKPALHWIHFACTD